MEPVFQESVKQLHHIQSYTVRQNQVGHLNMIEEWSKQSFCCSQAVHWLHNIEDQFAMYRMLLMFCYHRWVRLETEHLTYQHDRVCTDSTGRWALIRMKQYQQTPIKCKRSNKFESSWFCFSKYLWRRLKWDCSDSNK